MCLQGNCSDAAPADWQSLMKEPLPPGACVIRVPEDFIEMTFGVPELWIHNLYMLVDVALDAGEQGVNQPCKSGFLIEHL